MWNGLLKEEDTENMCYLQLRSSGVGNKNQCNQSTDRQYIFVLDIRRDSYASS